MDIKRTCTRQTEQLSSAQALKGQLQQSLRDAKIELEILRQEQSAALQELSQLRATLQEERFKHEGTE